MAKLGICVGEHAHQSGAEATRVGLGYVCPELPRDRVSSGKLLMLSATLRTYATATCAPALDQSHIRKPTKKCSRLPPWKIPLAEVSTSEADILPPRKMQHLRSFPEERSERVLEGKRNMHLQACVPHSRGEGASCVPVLYLPPFRLMSQNRKPHNVGKVTKHLWTSWHHPCTGPALARYTCQKKEDHAGSKPTQNEILHTLPTEVVGGATAPIEAQDEEPLARSSLRKPRRSGEQLDHEGLHSKVHSSAGLEGGSESPARTFHTSSAHLAT